MKTYGRWLDALSASRGNYVRFWMSNPFRHGEHAASGVHDEQQARRPVLIVSPEPFNRMAKVPVVVPIPGG